MNRRVLILAVAAILATAATAGAYWSTTGAGVGTGQSGAPAALTIDVATPTDALYPGSTASFAAQVSNPNNSSLQLSSLALDTSQGAGTGFESDKPGCAVSSLSFTPQSNGGAGWTVPSGTSTLSLDDALSMSADAADACQGATFSVYLKVGS